MRDRKGMLQRGAMSRYAATYPSYSGILFYGSSSVAFSSTEKSCARLASGDLDVVEKPDCIRIRRRYEA